MSYPAAPASVYLHQLQLPPIIQFQMICVSCNNIPIFLPLPWPHWCWMETWLCSPAHPSVVDTAYHQTPEKVHSHTRVSQMCFHWTNIIAAGGKLQFVKCWCELLPCSLWQRQPLGQLLWSCPTWFDCWLAEKKGQATNSGKEDIHWVKHKPWDGNRTNKIAIMPF